MRLLTTAIALAATLAATSPAAAVITAFAGFVPGAGGASVQWLNAASNSNAVFFTTATNSATVPGSRAVTFSFLQPALASIGPVTADWTMNGIVTNTPATIVNPFIIQNNITGSFSFISTSAITLGSITYAAGSNLLSGTFSQAAILGSRNASSANFSASTPMSSIVYTSDFLNFMPGSAYDFSMSLSQINPLLNALPTSGTPTRALRSFRAVATGQFSADPAPTAVVPEPAVWLQLIAGFGLVGFAARRRKIAAAA